MEKSNELKNKAELFRLYKEGVAIHAEITIEAFPAEEHPSGHFASGDDELDKETVAKIVADSEWNVWAWCIVKVTARYADLEASDYLGGCSYASEEDFLKGDYFEDMKDTVITELTHKVIEIEAQIDIEMRVCRELGLPDNALSLDGNDKYAPVLNNIKGVGTDLEREEFKRQVLNKLGGN